MNKQEQGHLNKLNLSKVFKAFFTKNDKIAHESVTTVFLIIQHKIPKAQKHIAGNDMLMTKNNLKGPNKIARLAKSTSQIPESK